MAGRWTFRHPWSPPKTQWGDAEREAPHDRWSFVSVVRVGSGRQIPCFTNGLGDGEGKAFGLTPTGPTIRREKPLARAPWTVPQTDTGRRVEDTKARERTLVKELGNLTP